MADLRQVVFGQTGHFHDGIAVESIVQHGARNIQSDLTGVFVDHCINVTFSKASGEHHYVFCLPRGSALALVVAIFHERMDLMARLSERLNIES